MDLPAMPVSPSSFMARGAPGDIQQNRSGLTWRLWIAAAKGHPETDPGRDQWPVVHAWFG
jgi:hypothetical protein